MPTEHKKKKAKKEKPVPIVLVKSEPIDLHPLEHYVDDRVELVRQIFGSLKTKTINSIIPDFLQKKTHEELQEICLEELLGISKKRLTSIINATKCPSDTESSDSDASDVENIEEHISLEEISSDSEDELNKSKKSKKHSSKSSKKAAPSAAAAKTATTGKPSDPKAPATDANGKPTGEKQYSILELLELQARARAIRSQLALEPVTKIELDDSDDDIGDTNSKEPEATKSPKEVPTNDRIETPMAVTEPAASSVVNQKTAEPIQSISQPIEEPRVPSSRPIRLKRNFRSRQIDEEDVPGPEPENTEKVAEKSAEDNVEKDVEKSPAKSPEKSEENDKSTASPPIGDGPSEKQNTAAEEEAKDDDIIPIIQEPEILCITSSDSENEDAQFLNKVKRSYITMPTVEKEIRPPTEDELFLERVKQKTSIEAVLKQSAEKVAEEPTAKAGGSDKTEKVVEAPIVEALEDGEIIEDDPVEDEPIEGVSTQSEVVDLADSSDEEIQSGPPPGEPIHETSSATEENKSDAHAEESSEKSIEEKASSKESDTDTDDEDSTEQVVEKRAELPKRSDDEDEDIIDLGKDEDLDFEIKNDKNPEPKNESWDTRWLRNNKVSRVLATAKLQNKVRSKIKEKKTKTAIEVAQKEESIEPTVEPPVEVPTNVEVGSVEHYKELTKKK